MGKEDIRRYTLDEIEEMVARGEDETRPDAPVYEIDEDFWRNAKVVFPQPRPPKTSVHLRLDQDVFDWFKSQGGGHLSRMNAVLRAYYEAHRQGEEKGE